MKTIEFMPGETIESAASKLVAAAPAQGTFNGIKLTVNENYIGSDHVVFDYRLKYAGRAATYAASPEGKRAAAEAVERLAQAQATVDVHVFSLAHLDFADTDAVIAWVAGVADAADHVDIKLNRAALREMFVFSGWGIGVNCGRDFDGEDERNFAGWIVGQWLDCWHPMVNGFIEQWRTKFRPAGFRAIA